MFSRMIRSNRNVRCTAAHVQSNYLASLALVDYHAAPNASLLSFPMVELALLTSHYNVKIYLDKLIVVLQLLVRLQLPNLRGDRDRERKKKNRIEDMCKHLDSEIGIIELIDDCGKLLVNVEMQFVVCSDMKFTFGPIIEYCLCNIASRIGRAEQKFLCFSTHENQTQVYLQKKWMKKKKKEKKERKTDTRQINHGWINWTQTHERASKNFSTTLIQRRRNRYRTFETLKRTTCALNEKDLVNLLNTVIKTRFILNISDRKYRLWLCVWSECGSRLVFRYFM